MHSCVQLTARLNALTITGYSACTNRRNHNLRWGGAFWPEVAICVHKGPFRIEGALFCSEESNSDQTSAISSGVIYQSYQVAQIT